MSLDRITRILESDMSDSLKEELLDKIEANLDLSEEYRQRVWSLSDAIDLLAESDISNSEFEYSVEMLFNGLDEEFINEVTADLLGKAARSAAVTRAKELKDYKKKHGDRPVGLLGALRQGNLQSRLERAKNFSNTRGEVRVVHSKETDASKAGTAPSQHFKYNTAQHNEKGERTAHPYTTGYKPKGSTDSVEKEEVKGTSSTNTNTNSTGTSSTGTGNTNSTGTSSTNTNTNSTGTGNTNSTGTTVTLKNDPATDSENQEMSNL